MVQIHWQSRKMKLIRLELSLKHLSD